MTTGEMAKRLRGLAALAQLGSQHQHWSAYKPTTVVPGDPVRSSGLLEHARMCTRTLPHTLKFINTLLLISQRFS